MVFSTAIFLFAFFPIVFIGYRLMPGIKTKNIFLTLASLIFYAFGQPEYLLLLLFSVFCNYFAGRLMAQDDGHRKAVAAGAIVVNLLLLCAFKYLGFMTENVNVIFGLSIPMPNISLPIGISFFTFQGLSYVIDVYRNKKNVCDSFGKLLLYISLFPQLLAGPIIIYHDIAEQIDRRECTPELTADGIRRFIIGLSKKIIIANAMGRIADSVFALDAAQFSMGVAWLGAVCYALQIYFDFSGYSDMAIGLAKCFGFKFLENFQYPYTTTSIRSFWRHWHISLSTWFRDYLYIPLGGNRNGRLRCEINKCIVFFCTGLWHGASWTFVIWGMWHGLFIVLEDIGVIPTKKMNNILGNIYTLLVVICGFVLFRADNIHTAWTIIKSMFTGFSYSAAANELILRTVNFYNITVFAVAIIASTRVLPFVRRVCAEKGKAIQRVLDAGTYGIAVVLLIISVINMASSTFNPFIYFRF